MDRIICHPCFPNFYLRKSLTDAEDAYHSSYDEIMREESNPSDVIEIPTSNVISRQRDSLKPEPAANHAIQVRNNLKPDSVPSQGLHVKDNLRPDPLPTPIPYVSTSDHQPGRATTPPVTNHTMQVPSTPTPQTNGPKSITMYYNRPKIHDAQNNDTVLNLIPLESVQSTPTTLTPPPSESVGKRKRIEYDDEDELFCLSLVPTLKRLGPRNKTIAKMRFQQVLFDLEFPANE